MTETAAPQPLFVSVVAYCDPELPRTLLSLVTRATHPERIHFAVVDQCDPKDALHEVAAIGPGIDYVQLHYKHARGPGFARAMAMQCYRGEPLYLQIDGHMHAAPGWDVWVEQTVQSRPRTVWSSYPPPYDLVDGQPVPQVQAPQTVVAHVVNEGEAFAEDGKWTLTFGGRYTHSPRPRPGFHVAAGLVCGPGAIVEAVPYDPQWYFWGEEQAWSVRLWTHGFDVWHPVDVPLYHLYNNPEQTVRPTHWRVDHDERRRLRWWQYEQQSVERQRLLYTGGLQDTVYGLGTARSLKEFALYSGIDYAARRLLPQAFTIREPEET